jgi:mRNA interferase RelE/StbE
LNLIYSKQAEKYLNSQNDKGERIKVAVSKLPKGDVIKLRGSSGKYRLRVGNFRVVFTKDANTIYIEAIDSRGQVYKH